MSDSDYQYEQPYGGEEGSANFEESYRAALEPFWAQQKQEISQSSTDISEYKSQQLPLARIKKIMKSDEDVRMISAEAPVLFAKACELFILDLTIRGWVHAEDNRRRTLQRSDIASTIAHWEVLDFLSDVIPVEEGKPEGQTATDGHTAPTAAPATGLVTDMTSLQQVPGVYYAPPSGLPHYQDVMPSPVDVATMGTVPELLGPLVPNVVPVDEPPVAAVMYEQWSSEGQAQAAAAAAHGQQR